MIIGILVQNGFSARKVMSLNGTWECTKGAEATIPTTFGATVPVPGLISMTTGTTGSGSWWWYRKSFTLTETQSQVALIKIHKAKYGTRVYLNGTLVGEHLPCHTPGYFNIRPYINFSGSNVLVVRTGAQSSLPSSLFDAKDFEKTTFPPGIYDAVELIMCNSPRVVSVQTAPALNNTVKIIAAIKNESSASYSGSVTYTVRRVDNNATVGEAQANVTIGAGATTTNTVTVTISNCQYWSPQIPFLYEVATTTEGDERIDRFGMTTFRFRPPDFWPELNGEIISLLGTNVCPGRFEDDPEVKLLFDTAWVRKLIKEFKRMNWNSMRTHIGFLPDFWYDIMDEEGFMIQDEFPIWGWAYNNNVISAGKTVDQLKTEGSEWIYQRCNHPSLYCWDIANETGYGSDDGKNLTGPAIDYLRTLDIRNLPWDNSYGPRRKEGDICEVHPYVFSSPGGSLLKLLTTSDDPLAVGAQMNKFQPAVNNEFEWIWINRDGSPTTLTTNFYNYMIGFRLYGDPLKGTAAERRHLYDQYLSALIEFWRVGRKCRIIHAFPGLNSSVPGESKTSDFWLPPLSALTMSDEYGRFVRHASAPVCLCIKRYDDEYVAATTQKIGVKVLNDTKTAWSKEVQLLIRKTDDTSSICSVTKNYSINPFDTVTQTFTITMPSIVGKYNLIAQYYDGKENIQSVREFNLIADQPLSFRKTVTVSSENSSNKGSNAVDWDYWTRWESTSRNTEWICVDLGTKQNIGRIKLLWDQGYASSYSVQVSDNASTWTTIQAITNGAMGYKEIITQTAEGRYVRIYCQSPGSTKNYSLIEFQVFGRSVVDIIAKNNTLNTNNNGMILSVTTAGSQLYIHYQLPEKNRLQFGLNVYSIKGNIIKKYNGNALGTDNNGFGQIALNQMSTGVYIIRLSYGKKRQDMKAVYLH